METETVHVELLDEGTPTLRPVEAVPLGDDCYRLVPTPDYDPEDETWAFLPGTVVRCLRQDRSDGPALVAVKEVTPPGSASQR